MAHEKVPFSKNKHRTDIVAYLTLIGWLIAYFKGDREGSRMHLDQALTILAADLGLNLVFACITLTGTAEAALLMRGVIALLSFGVLCLWILAFVRACMGNEKPVPILGEVHLLEQLRKRNG